MDGAARGWTRFLVLLGLVREPGSPTPAPQSRRQRILQFVGLFAIGFAATYASRKVGF